MAINFDNALGIHPLALSLRERRTEVLASNIANSDTPNYKARDLDFQSVLKGVSEPVAKLVQTQKNHLSSSGAGHESELKYRVPDQSSLDGNTVESQKEQVRYAQNAMDYQFSLRIVSDKFSGIRTALTGD
ncbi:flagellar basal body rod protein FlgB [Methylococcus sp. EFPC2]|uniref:flagellar basal body rod protein FlgB n=1 Tax=Methylococcus sp. EFPC2 TaxID=2812648 RepID=UPI0019674B6D|nr:flagellar basal body rod protein FlgB [Methylococcus sp. EFPC2]QSA98375.1 flagellar basal body rod protein FlgB [Methylococcus sp. EFPC2]